ncbi:MAG: HNH endonuclease [Candidatus Cloacimonetes bacterium]|nr:HNH endonuclease [Candidatus Cloacimonadota bacterium]
MENYTICVTLVQSSHDIGEFYESKYRVDIHHIKPLSRGGKDTIENLEPEIYCVR